MTWDILASDLAGQQQGVTVQLTRLMLDLWSRQQKQADTALLLDILERRARIGVFQAADLAARVQYQDLVPGSRHPQALVDVAERLATVRAQLIRERADAVLRRATEGMVSPYARLAAQVLVNDAARTGLKAGGISGDATHKQFIRLRPVQEPRSHSRYEGTIRPIDGTWLIAGIEVDGPGDPRLPWSERAWCGHICKYIRR